MFVSKLEASFGQAVHDVRHIEMSRQQNQIPKRWTATTIYLDEINEVIAAADCEDEDRV